MARALLLDDKVYELLLKLLSSGKPFRVTRDDAEHRAMEQMCAAMVAAGHPNHSMVEPPRVQHAHARWDMPDIQPAGKETSLKLLQIFKNRESYIRLLRDCLRKDFSLDDVGGIYFFPDRGLIYPTCAEAALVGARH